MSADQTYFENLLAQFTARADDLNALDAAVGDGDHGSTMLRGLTKAQDAQDGARARAFMRASGGAAGTLFGLLLVGIERHLVEGADLAEQVSIAAERICDLGQVSEGDKSMVDALAPAARTLNEKGDLAAAIEAARSGRDATRDLEARRGRAQYVEHKGKGHIDPGATSIVVLFETLQGINGAGS